MTIRASTDRVTQLSSSEALHSSIWELLGYTKVHAYDIA